MVGGMTEPADLPRLLGDLLSIGIVASVDLAAGEAVVEIGEISLPGIKWATGRAGAARIWCPPAVGEQVLVASPEGDLEGGLIVASLSYERFPSPAGDASTVVAFEDGTTLAYDPGAAELTAIVAGGTARISAPAGITLIGPLKVEGDVAIAGKLDATGDVVGAGKSLKDHKHTAVAAGQALSGPPA